MKRSRYCDYTSKREFAGVYPIADGVRHAKGCTDLKIVPVDVGEHNAYIMSLIEKLEARKI